MMKMTLVLFSDQNLNIFQLQKGIRHQFFVMCWTEEPTNGYFTSR